jgi:hypothetical protein
VRTEEERKKRKERRRKRKEEERGKTEEGFLASLGMAGDGWL